MLNSLNRPAGGLDEDVKKPFMESPRPLAASRAARTGDGAFVPSGTRAGSPVS